MITKVPTGMSLRPASIDALNTVAHRNKMSRSALVERLILLMAALERDGGFMSRSEEIIMSARKSAQTPRTHAEHALDDQ